MQAPVILPTIPSRTIAASARTDRWRKRVVRRRILIGAGMADAVAILSGFLAASFVRGGVPDGDQIVRLGALSLVLYGASGLQGGAFSLRALSSFRCMVVIPVRSLVLALLFVLMVLFVAKVSSSFSRFVFVLAGVFSLTLLFLLRVVVFKMAGRLMPDGPTQELVIHDFEEPSSHPAAFHARDERLDPDPGDIACVSRLTELADGADRLVVHCPPERREAWADMLKALTIHAEIGLPELDRLQPLAITRRDGQVLALVSENPLNWHEALIKRLSDLVLTLAAMPLVLPVLALVALAIKLDSPGPVFFRQVRMGFGNRTFRVMKFRSMRDEASDHHGTRSTDRADDRITRVGRLIRKTSLDELPQLLNVLRGDMSLVGPRPHALGSTAGGRLFWQVNHHYWVRHRIKPGLTGLAQVRGYRGNTLAEDDLQNRLMADLEYLSNWSLWRDLLILLRTLRVLHDNNAF